MSATPHTPSIPTMGEDVVSGGDPAHGVFWAALSCRGSRGGANEDAVLARPPHFFGVADGVGSGSHGEVASQVALRHCAAAQDLAPQSLVRQVQGADCAVAQALASLSDRPGAATLVVVWLLGRVACLVHVGDARALLFRRGWGAGWRLAWRTQDQTYAELGRTPPEGGDADDPCRMVGTGAVGDPALTRFSLRRHDLLLLCSDGLHRYVPEQVLTAIVSAALRAGLELDAIAGQLVRQAVHNGGTDDVTVLLLRLAPDARRWVWPGVGCLAGLATWGAMRLWT